VASEGPGRGSVSTVRLPIAANQSGNSVAAADAEVIAIPRKRILVVDDNTDAAESLAAILKFMGAEVRVANSGPGALEAFPVFDPALVMLDIGMPGMDGYEVARRMRGTFPGRRATLVALTGWGQEEDQRKAREAGFDHHLVKPADIGDLQKLFHSLEPQGV